MKNLFFYIRVDKRNRTCIIVCRQYLTPNAFIAYLNKVSADPRNIHKRFIPLPHSCVKRIYPNRYWENGLEDNFTHPIGRTFVLDEFIVPVYKTAHLYGR